MMPIILIFIFHYLPGYKAGGPIRTVENIVDRLSDAWTFEIITADRDMGDDVPYFDVPVNVWQRVAKADVLYLPPSDCSLRGLRRVLRAIPHNLLYFNSFFNPTFTTKPLLLRRLGWIENIPVVIAPRGEFSPGALELKRAKKRLFLRCTKSFGLYRNVVWHASNNGEECDIRREFGDSVPIVIANNLSIRNNASHPRPRRGKHAGMLRCLFLSRVSSDEESFAGSGDVG
jgi:hypothetical protein